MTITYALSRKDETLKALTEFLSKRDAIYFAPWSFLEVTKIEDDTWGQLQLVAIHGGAIKGYLKANIDRGPLNISNLSVCKFRDGHEEEFAADLARIIEFLRSHFRRIHWSVIAGAPTEPVWRRVCETFGGREVGRFNQNSRLRNGELADSIWFEVDGTDAPDGVTMIPAEWSA